ncbi:alkaline phosphatase [Bacillus manliponensis]|uniref:Alkaline phosphatase n=1 Tax=Bacillus manliponensis TaxID=574376 RepID=A0A073JQ08_9BACI|nr:anti sigma factor C-terminal domain-containing protein [Bacillus manliponensis]KEK17169.1 alkaline phosphatase [Bacillus manliponensis]
MSRDEFDFDVDDSKVERMLKKARWKQLFKMILISSVLFIVLSLGGAIGLSHLQQRAYNDTTRDVEMMRHITRPNTELGAITRHDGLLKSTVEYQTYKVIEGQPVAWEEEVYTFKVWNSFRELTNKNPLTIVDDAVVGLGKIDQTSERYNYQTMQRDMQFYFPFLAYHEYINDAKSLHDENTVAELAVSFDSSYTVSEIKEMLPEGVRPVWYWVDTYDDKEWYKGDDPQFFTESSYDVYGFSAQQGEIEYGNGTEKDFLLAIESGLKAEGKYYDEYKRLYNYLRGDKKKPTEEDVKIFGVVVTGTEAALGQLHEASYAKATALGATAEKR